MGNLTGRGIKGGIAEKLPEDRTLRGEDEVCFHVEPGHAKTTRQVTLFFDRFAYMARYVEKKTAAESSNPAAASHGGECGAFTRGILAFA